MIFPFIVLFSPPIALKERRSISNTEHVLPRVFNAIHDRHQLRRRKRSK